MRGASTRRAWGWLAPLAFALQLGCGTKLDRYSDVADLRILAVRADPPEVTLTTLGPVDVSFEALVLDPRNESGAYGALEYAWSFCPVETGKACADFAEKRDAAAPELRDALDEMHALGARGVAAYAPDATDATVEERASRAVWPFAVAPFAVHLDTDTATSLLAYHLEDNLLGLGVGAWPSAVLEAHKLGGTREVDQVVGFKRFVLSVRDVGDAAAVLGVDLGFTVCAGDAAPETQPGCVPLRPRVANENPEFAGVRIAEGELAGTDFADWEGPYTLGVGQKIRVLPVLTEASTEAYQELETDLDTQVITAVERVEEISVSWFVTGGELAEALTWPKFTKTLDTVFTAPKTPGAVSIYMVARDQRGGIAWRNLEIVVTE